jgi:hypothetical protein
MRGLLWDLKGKRPHILRGEKR